MPLIYYESPFHVNHDKETADKMANGYQRHAWPTRLKYLRDSYLNKEDFMTFNKYTEIFLIASRGSSRLDDTEEWLNRESELKDMDLINVVSRQVMRSWAESLGTKPSDIEVANAKAYLARISMIRTGVLSVIVIAIILHFVSQVW